MGESSQVVGSVDTGRRVVAALIDIGVGAALSVALSAIAGSISGEGPNGSSGFTVQLNGGWFLLWLGLAFGYFAAAEALTGRTLGKLVVGMQVVSVDGGRIGWGQAVGRNLLRFVDALPAFYLVGFLAAVFSEKGQRLGDMAAGTLVVRRMPVASPGTATGAEANTRSW